ncbi:MAG: fused MFS/spermidine synthase [Planctomycetota bacterium]|jgi:tetratricopeptide (TPR) repeat protein
MVIGGGGYVYPRYIEKHWPGSRIDVAEIDPGVTEAAIQAFGLKRNTSINTISMDARNYVDELLEQERTGGEKTRYDFIYEDALDHYSIPFQLVTKEFNDKIATLLGEKGIYMIELIDIFDSGLFLGAYINTLQQTFPYVYAITTAGEPRSMRNTFVLVTSKKELNLDNIAQDYKKVQLELWNLNESDISQLKDKSKNLIMTDDYAPVENLLAPVVCQSAKEIVAREYLQQAEKLKQEKNWQQSILKYKKALQLNPSMSIKAYNEIGIIQVTQGNLEKAAQAFQGAIDYHEQFGSKENVIASIHLNLGILLKKMEKPQQVQQHLRKAAELFRADLVENPNDILLWTRLGETLAIIGDFEAASEAFKKAVAIEPSNPLYHNNLAKALEYQGKYDEAITVLKRAIDLMLQQGQKEAAAQLKNYLELIEFRKSKHEK